MIKKASHAPVSRQARMRSVVGCASLLIVIGWPTCCIADEPLQHSDAYPEAASKKGLQVELVDDALALGVKHAAINVNLSRLIAPSAEQRSPALLHWSRNGRMFSFHRD